MCIVQSLISETSTELTEELQKTQGLQLDHSFQSPDDYECLDDWENWMPDPVDALSKTNSRRTRRRDSTASVRGHAEGHWRQQEDQLPASHSGWRMSRAADPSLPSQCSCIVRTVLASVQEWNIGASTRNWRSFGSLHESFSTGNRTLVWKPHLGFANIDLEIGDKKVNITVTPVQAAIITTTCGQYQGFCFYLEEKNYILAISRNYRGKFSRRVLSCGRWWR